MPISAWQNLALAAAVLFFVLQFGADLAFNNLCGNLGIDYCAFWSAGRVANQYGYEQVYNLDRLAEVQKSIHPQGGNQDIRFGVVPVPYLGVFLIPFALLATFDLQPGFWAWTAANLLGMILYARFFIQRVTGQRLTTRAGLLVLVSMPVFLTFFYGQVNVILMIACGEFFRAMTNGKPFKAGLWLGVWLIKPQLLVLAALALLMRRAWKVLGGLVVASILALAGSLALVKMDGMIALLRLLIGYTEGLPTNAPQIMMNWRMIGLHITQGSSPLLGWGLVALGMAATVIIALVTFGKPTNDDVIHRLIALTGLCAATGLVAWHAHLHMAMILIPSLAALWALKQLPEKLMLLWTFIPTGLTLLTFILAVLMNQGYLPSGIAGWLDMLSGLRGFIVNLALLAWAVVAYCQQKPADLLEPFQAAA